jgi:hypothetical protein
MTTYYDYNTEICFLKKIKTSELLDDSTTL